MSKKIWIVFVVCVFIASAYNSFAAEVETVSDELESAVKTDVKIQTENILPVERKDLEIEKLKKKHLMVGQICPDFTGMYLGGEDYDSIVLKDKIAIISFWTEWCPSCIKELPMLEDLFRDLKNDENVALITIAGGRKELIANIVKEKSYTFPVLFDGNKKIANIFKIDRLPQIFIVDAKGMIVSGYLGYHQDIEEKAIYDDLNKLKANKSE
ncbi:MAG: hypothetical protein DRP78_00260 [Candidatus Omnitrophota bacterium]|nr:MAG: hypothetical protein DRP78_00260 [Candidatus Omnitrophota bacterium]